MCFLFCAPVLSPQYLNAQTKADESAQASAATREERLAEYLSGVKMTGNFTVTGREKQALTPEEYFIVSAEKQPEGDWWKLTARIKYGNHDVTVPMAMEIKWAGETPVITVDQMLVPGMGTFDARVLIRKGSYAGTWAHDDVGGQLFGSIEKMTDAELKGVQAASEQKRSERKKGEPPSQKLDKQDR
jgi:hypothetical protein